MILPEDFPYITSIYVNDCYTYQNFNIDLIKHQPFSHLILTGKNGSGKSTILRLLNNHFLINFSGTNVEKYNKNNTGLIEANRDRLSEIEVWKSEIRENNAVELGYNSSVDNYINYKRSLIYSYILPYRNSKVHKVETPTKQDIFEKKLENIKESSQFFIQNFKQYLVNKKVNQAFDQLKNKTEDIEKTNIFFNEIESVFSKIFEDKSLKLEFMEDTYEFFIRLSDGRELTFDILPDGFSAFLSILMDLFVRLDLIRKVVGNNTYNPCGIVLIDEPETHLHISLQYHVLPILTTLFPNVQFIVATHSPAVISSIKNSTIFDLTTKETLSSDDAIGKSFSELMVSHFGLDNEFSDFTDDLFEKVNTVLKENKSNIQLRNQQLKAILEENERYISPTMRFELEAKISE